MHEEISLNPLHTDRGEGSGDQSAMTKPLHCSVVAVVVTFNRLTLLKRCLATIRDQTRPPDQIFVINNASTDGTHEYLIAEKGIHYINSESNLGGAGGFALGFQKAIESNCSFIWPMDDDGYPAPNCLELLVNSVEQLGLDSISPVHIDTNDISSLSFPLRHGAERIWEVALLANHPLFPDQANLFNGMLIRRTGVLALGLPRPEFFIRGDETEYFFRMRKHGLRFAALSAARFYHPSDKAERFTLAFGRGHVQFIENPLKNFYLHRNKAYVLKEYGEVWKVYVSLVVYFSFFIIYRKLDVKNFVIWLKATRAGLDGRLGKLTSAP